MGEEGESKTRKQTNAQVVVTANALLKGPPSNPTYSVYFGYDYATSGERSILMGESWVLRNLGDLERLPKSFTVDDFASVFERTFSETGVTVVGLVSLVYLIRKVLHDFSGERVTLGRVHKTLF